MLRRPQASHLGGVEGTAPGTVHAEGARRLAGAIQARKGGLPVLIHGHAAVAMLGAHRDLQPLPIKVDAVMSVELDGTEIHGLQPLNGGAEEGPRAGQIVVGLGGQDGKSPLQPLGVLGVVQEYAVAPLDLGGHQKIHLGGALRLADVKGPLVALEEDEARGFLPQGIVQKFPFMPLGVHADVAGEHLLIGAREVPAEFHAGHAVLPLLHVGEGHPRLNGQARGAVLAFGIDRVAVDPRGASRAEDHVLAGDDRPLPRDGGDAGHARDGLPVGEDLHRPPIVQKGNALAGAGALQGLGHVFGGQGAAGGGPTAGVMVGLVARVFAVFVGGEGNAQLHQAEEAAGGVGRLAQGMLSHDAAPGVEGVRHFAHAVPVRAAEGELVVGLLVAARVAGGAHAPSLGEDGDVRDPQVVELIGGVKACAPRADDECMVGVFHSFLMCMPPSKMKDWPVV